MSVITFKKTYDGDELKCYDVFEDGGYIGELGREFGEWAAQSEWAIDAALEERFGMNFASGHKRVQSVMKELRQAGMEASNVHTENRDSPER